MKIYRANYFHGQEGCIVSWHGSRRAAEQALREQHAELNGEGELIVNVEAQNIPGTKAGFLVWLNNHFIRDNG